MLGVGLSTQGRKRRVSEQKVGTEQVQGSKMLHAYFQALAMNGVAAAQHLWRLE
jgi:hypothetical protein